MSRMIDDDDDDDNTPLPWDDNGADLSKSELSRAVDLRTDFFIANLAELARMDLKEGPRYFPMVPSRRVDPLTIADLDTILTGEPERLPLVIREADEGGPWIALLEEAFCQALIDLNRDDDPEALGQAAGQWSESEGWDSGIGPPENLNTLIKDLANLCQRAFNEQKKVFVWIAT